jgi:hypothetical protein
MPLLDKRLDARIRQIEQKMFHFVVRYGYLVFYKTSILVPVIPQSAGTAIGIPFGNEI